MQVNKKNHKKKIFIAIIILIVIAVAVCLSYVFLRNQDKQGSVSTDDRSANSVDYNKPTESQKEEGTRAKSDFIERQEQKETDSPKSNNQGGAPSISITNIGYNGSTLQIRTTVMSAATGVCQLTLSRQGETTLSQEAATQSLGSYDTCKGFDIDTANLKKGTWNLALRYTGDAQGVNVTRTIEVQ